MIQTFMPLSFLTSFGHFTVVSCLFFLSFSLVPQIPHSTCSITEVIFFSLFHPFFLASSPLALFFIILFQSVKSLPQTSVPLTSQESLVSCPSLSVLLIFSPSLSLLPVVHVLLTLSRPPSARHTRSPHQFTLFAVPTSFLTCSSTSPTRASSSLSPSQYSFTSHQHSLSPRLPVNTSHQTLPSPLPAKSERVCFFF